MTKTLEVVNLKEIGISTAKLKLKEEGVNFNFLCNQTKTSVPPQMATKRWADDTDEMGNFRAELVESQSADGREFIKVITEFKTNEKGLKVKVATRVRVTRKAVRVNQKVKERRVSDVF